MTDPDGWVIEDGDPWADDPPVPKPRAPSADEVDPFDVREDAAAAGVLSERAERARRLTYTRSTLDRIPPPAWIIDGVLSDGALSLLSGKFGTYKTFVALSWACSVATGVPWFGHSVKVDGPVVYVAAEGVRGIGSRLRAWELHNLGGGRIADDRLRVIGGPMLLTHAGDVEVMATVEGAALIVWDTLHRCAPGVEENSNSDMGRVITNLAEIRDRARCTQLVVHHTGHAGTRSRGASSLEDDFEDSWVIQLGGDGEDRSPANPRTMRHRKAKDFTLSAEIGLVLEVEPDGGARVVPRDAEAEERAEEWVVRQRILAVLDAAGLPLSAGRQRCRAALRAAGVTIGDRDLEELLRTRKTTPLSPELPLED